MIDIMPVLEAIIALAATLITMKLIPYIKLRLTVQQQEMLMGTTRTLVYAAEQIFGSGTGAKKLEYVQRALEERGFQVDMAVIEAAVRELTHA